VSSGHILHAIGHWLVFARVGHSGLLRAALTALVGWVAIGLVNLYLTRKRIAWRAYMGTEVSLHPQQARRIEEARKAEPNGPQVKFRVYIEKPELQQRVELFAGDRHEARIPDTQQEQGGIFDRRFPV